MNDLSVRDLDFRVSNVSMAIQLFQNMPKEKQGLQLQSIQNLLDQS
jgi:hypothetical protein